MLIEEPITERWKRRAIGSALPAHSESPAQTGLPVENMVMDVMLHPDVERMILEHVRSGEYSTTSELLNAAVRNLLADERGGTEKLGKHDPRSLELAQDAPANLEWLNRNGVAYQGEWVALHKGTLIAHGENGLEVFRAAQAAGIDPPLMHRIVPEEPVSWGGW